MMFHVIHAPSRRFSLRRAHDRVARPTPTTPKWPMSRAEAFAIGLGCDNYKR